MKMTFSVWVKKGGFQTIEAKSEIDAFDKFCAKFGVNNFTGFKRYYENQNQIEHTQYFLKRAISNTTIHIHKQNKRGI